jgi:anti-anti-sigma factor
VVEEAGRTVIYLAGELDLATRDDLRQRLAALHGRVVADLSGVAFLDSSTIGVLIKTRNRLVADDGELELRNPQELPRRALETVGLKEWIE